MSSLIIPKNRVELFRAFIYLLGIRCYTLVY